MISKLPNDVCFKDLSLQGGSKCQTAREKVGDGNRLFRGTTPPLTRVKEIGFKSHKIRSSGSKTLTV